MYYILVMDQGLPLEFSHRSSPRDPDGPVSPPGRCVSQDRVRPDLRVLRRLQHCRFARAASESVADGAAVWIAINCAGKQGYIRHRGHGMLREMRDSWEPPGQETGAFLIATERHGDVDGVRVRGV